MYGEHHVDHKIKEAFPSTDNNLVVLKENFNGELQVKAVMSAGCHSTLDLTLIGEDKGAMFEPPEKQDIFSSDHIWEQMIRQAWLDIVKTMNRDKALYGVPLRPLLLDPLMPQPIAISDEMAGYHVSSPKFLSIEVYLIF